MMSTVVILAIAPLQAAIQAATLQGVVYDSLSARPLREATVQVVSTGDSTPPRTWAATTDSAGRYRVPALPAGRYVAGFFHPVLDSLGFEPALRPIVVTPGSQRADWAVPSARTIQEAICPAETRGDSTALLIGHVRRTSDRQPLAGATVAVAWTELVQGALLLKPEERLRSAETTAEGWFALCGVPGEASVLARVAYGADSTGFVRLSVPAGGLRHLTFHVGGAVLRKLESDPNFSNSWRGEARLAGLVRDDRGRPLPDAEVTVWGTGLGARTGSRGTFRLDSLPGGTQTLEVRAVGFTPVQRVVQLVPDGPREVELQLTERAVALPEVTVRAAATRTLQMTRFYERMRDAEKGINHGHFITLEDMERRRPANVTQMFDGLGGIQVWGNVADPKRGMRVYGPQRINIGGQRCLMNVYLDGVRVLPTLHGEMPDAIDELVNPTSIAGMEVYPRAVQAPPQYQSLNGMCGVILIWTK